jgi:acetyl-CoA C-acetyltransferase
MNDAVIASAARLPIGKFGGALKDVSDWDLGTIVIAEAMKRAGVKGDDIDEVISVVVRRSKWNKNLLITRSRAGQPSSRLIILR